jgi:hypothetical protein
MTTPNPIPHLDEPAQQQALIRRLQRDLEAERDKTARERKSNSSLALELYEARAEAKALRGELEEARLNFVRTGVAHSVNLQAEIDLRELRWTQLREQIKAQPPVSRHLPGLVHVLNLMDALEWPESSNAYTGEKSPSAYTAPVAVAYEAADAHARAGGCLLSMGGTRQTRFFEGRFQCRDNDCDPNRMGQWDEWSNYGPKLQRYSGSEFYIAIPQDNGAAT